MNDIENTVVKHYGNGGLLSKILTGLQESGKDIEKLKPDDLLPVEEFHIGGRKSTEHLVKRLNLSTESQIVDIGCGIGGAMRYLASQKINSVTGIDLTPEYISVAKELSKRVMPEAQLVFKLASALNMPFEDESFDAAITMHVAMNIQNRSTFYSEIARVIKPNGKFGLFDVVKKGEDDLIFPLPWATSSAASHLVSENQTTELLNDAGFVVIDKENRTEFALEFFNNSLASQANEIPSLGIHLLMGDTAKEKFVNVLSSLKSGRIAVSQIIAEKR